jgi:hypothetical protein
VIAVVATVLCATTLTTWHTAQPALGRRNKPAAEEPLPTPPLSSVSEPPRPNNVSTPPPNSVSASAASPESNSWAGWINSMFAGSSAGSAADIPAVAVGAWRAGDPWPGGVACDSGKLTDAFHMKPDIGCEPNCEQCQMVCLPSAFTGPFKNHGGELGSNCFERGCSEYAGEGSRSGVKFYMYNCDLELQRQWKAMNSMSLDQAKLNLEECIAACKKKDKSCILTCEVTHKDVSGELPASRAKRAASRTRARNSGAEDGLKGGHWPHRARLPGAPALTATRAPRVRRRWRASRSRSR